MLPLVVLLLLEAAPLTSFRGLSAPARDTVWGSGTRGSFARYTHHRWVLSTVPGAEALDFRAIDALDARTAWLMSAGPGPLSRVYRTPDAGQHWTLQFTDPDEHGFWDALHFWDARHGILLGDPVGDVFTIFTTDDAGLTWQRRFPPPANPDEGAFAASNTSLVLRGHAEAWFATGGRGGGRVFHSSNRGRTWTVTQTPVRHDSPAAGIFSLVWLSATHGIAAGGDYAHPADPTGNLAVTTDAGLTWAVPDSRPNGYRSALAVAGRLLIAVGPTGTDISRDGGTTWLSAGSLAFHTVAACRGQVWAAGPEGRLARWNGSQFILMPSLPAPH